MERHLIPALLLMLTGCYDFQGERGALGFATELELGPEGAWTPDHPVALGSSAWVYGGRDEEGEHYTATASGVLEVTEGGEDFVRVSMSRVGEGSLRFDGPTWDRFAVEVVPVAEARVEDPLRQALGEEPTARLALLPGQPATLALSLRDARGRSLGWSGEDLEFRTGPGLSAWFEDGVLQVVSDSEPGACAELAVLLHGELLGDVELCTVVIEDLARLRLVEVAEVEGETLWGLRGELEDGTPLLGLQPIWTGAEPLVERADVALGAGDPPRARVGALEVDAPVEASAW